VLVGEVKDAHVDELYPAAVKVVLDCGRGSGSELQRRLHIGYAVARRLIERMEVEAIVGPRRGGHPRKVLIGGKDGQDDLYDAAVKVVLNCGRGSVNEIQRRLNVGRRRSHRLIESMTAAGILGEHCDGRPRKLLIGREKTDPRRSEQEC
jgi:DNA segregation ATPase FtsK/SpoIIIE-like protein